MNILQFPLTLSLINSVLKRTPWYKSLFVDYESIQYPDHNWCTKHKERNFDVVNLGSSSAYWAFDYSDLPLQAMNWAQAPQLLQNDLRILKNFHSVLNEGATVIVPLCFFSALYIDDTLADTLRYVRKVDRLLLNPALEKAASRLSENPSLLGLPALCALLGVVKRFGKYALVEDWRKKATCNKMSSAELEVDATTWIKGWMNQFSVDSLEGEVSWKNRLAMEKQSVIYGEIIDFCIERGYRVVSVLPPVTGHLVRFFSDKFVSNYILDFVSLCGRDVEFINYLGDAEFVDDQLYFNSFFLNRNGRRKFTSRVLQDIGLLSNGN